jgi:hypothetical protein
MYANLVEYDVENNGDGERNNDAEDDLHNINRYFYKSAAARFQENHDVCTGRTFDVQRQEAIESQIIMATKK